MKFFYILQFVVFFCNFYFIFSLFPNQLPIDSTNGVQFFVNDNLTSVGGCDINGDRVNDVILYGDNTAYIFYGPFSNGNFTFNSSDLNGNNGFKVIDPIGKFYQQVLCFDFNNDGYDEMFFINYGSFGGVFVIYGNETSQFPVVIEDIRTYIDGNNGFVIKGQSQSDSALASGRASLDFNGDSLNDLVLVPNPCVFSTSSCGQIGLVKTSYVIFGINGGKFPVNSSFEFNLDSLNGENGISLPDFYGSSFITTGDLNHDGIDDIAIAGNPGILIVAGRNSSVEPFTSGIYNPSFDGIDGFVINVSLPYLKLGQFTANQGYTIGIGDFNGDKKNDLAFTIRYYIIGGYKQMVFMLLGKGQGFTEKTINLNSFNESHGYKFSSEDESNSICDCLVFNDISHDGLSDLQCFSSSKSLYWVLFGTIHPLTQESQKISLNSSLPSTCEQYSSLSISGGSIFRNLDINNDNLFDLLLPHNNNTYNVIYGTRYYPFYIISNQSLYINNNTFYQIFNSSIQFNNKNNLGGDCNPSFISIEILNPKLTDSIQFSIEPDINKFTYSFHNNNTILSIKSSNINSSVFEIINTIHLNTPILSNSKIEFEISYQGLLNPQIYSISLIELQKQSTLKPDSNEINTDQKDTDNNLTGIIVGPVVAGLAVIFIIVYGIVYTLKDRTLRTNDLLMKPAF